MSAWEETQCGCPDKCPVHPPELPAPPSPSPSRGLRPPVRLRLWRVLQAAGGPLHTSEIIYLLPDLAPSAVRTELANLARGETPALIIQRVMEGVYQPIEGDERKATGVAALKNRVDN